jgi:hypothetical protein
VAKLGLKPLVCQSLAWSQLTVQCVYLERGTSIKRSLQRGGSGDRTGESRPGSPEKGSNLPQGVEKDVTEEVASTARPESEQALGRWQRVGRGLGRLVEGHWSLARSPRFNARAATAGVRSRSFSSVDFLAVGWGPSPASQPFPPERADPLGARNAQAPLSWRRGRA